MTERKKINWLLILQGWAMFWVVLGHSFVVPMDEGPRWVLTLYKSAQPFRMPLFMLVSGWLFYLTRLKPTELSGFRGGQWPYNQIISEKAIRLLLPGLVFSILAFVVKIAFPGEMTRQVGLSLKEVVHAFLYPNDNPFRELWFIATVFWYFILTPLWKIVLQRDWTMWLTVIVLVVLHFWYPNWGFLCLGKVFYMAIYFYLGLVICKKDIVERLFNKNPWFTLVIGIAIYVLGRFTNGFITSIGGIVFSFALALILDKYLPKTFFSFRKYTYQIFLMGIFAQMLVKILYRHFPIPYLVAYLLCIALGLYVPVLVSKLLERINWKPLLLCVGLKPKKQKS